MQSKSGFKKAPIKILFYLLCGAFPLSASAMKVDLSQGAKVEFDATGKPDMMSIKGTGAKAVGSLESKEKKVIGEFIVNLEEFTTDMDMRDEHMKEKYLETGKYKNTVLKINQNDIAEAFPVDGDWNPKNLKGLLTLHGVTKEVPLNCKLTVKDGTAKGVVDFKIRLPDYKIDIPSFAGITVADEVKIQVNVANKVMP